MNNTTSWSFCILAIILFSIAEIIGLYFVIIFGKYRNMKWFQKRYDHLTLMSGYLMQLYLIALLFRVVLYWPQKYYNINEDDINDNNSYRHSEDGTDQNSWWYQSIELLFITMDPLLIIVIVLWGYRCWLGHYRICYNYYMFEHMWKAAIDPLQFGNECASTNFYLKYITTYGNDQYLNIRVGIAAFIPYFLLVVLSFWVWGQGKELEWVNAVINFLHTTLLAIASVIVAILAMYRLRKLVVVFDDGFHFRTELMRITVRLIILDIISLIFLSLYYGGRQWFDGGYNLYLSVNMILCFSVACFIMYHNIWNLPLVIYQNSYSYKRKSVSQRRSEGMTSDEVDENIVEKNKQPLLKKSTITDYNGKRCLCYPLLLLSAENARKKKEKAEKTEKEMHLLNDELTLEQILSDSSAIEVFMKHLSKEFSLELILSVIEMTQFQEYVRSHILSDEFTIDTLEMNTPGSPYSDHNDEYTNASKGSSLSYLNTPTVMEQKNIRLPKDLPKSTLIHDATKINAYIDEWLKHWDERQELLQQIQSAPSSSQNLDPYPKTDGTTDPPSNSNSKSIVRASQMFDRQLLYCKIVAFELFNKYVRIGSQYQINISHTDRQKLTKLISEEYQWLSNDYESQMPRKSLVARMRSTFSEERSRHDSDEPVVPIKNLDKLFHVFDRCIVEMCVFMRQSYNRFRYTPEYVSLCHNI